MKWIDALDLERWSKKIGAREEFSELIADLIRASNLQITDFRFPSGNKSQVRGFDGKLQTLEASSYIPKGESLWEWGVNQNELKKLGDDFIKRTSKFDDLFRQHRTFVFVSPHTWDNPKQTLVELQDLLKATNKWADVKIIDGTQLERWLKESPAVAAKYARTVLGSYPHRGARSVDEFWEEFSAKFKPKLTEDVLLCGRSAQIDELLTFLSGTTGSLTLVADSPEEVTAFAVAAIRKSKPDLRFFLESRTLIVDSEEAARELAHRRGLVLVASGRAQNQAGLLSSSAPVLVGKGRDTVGGNNPLLARPSTDDLANALRTMALSETDAEKLAKTCGRSVTILARRIPNGSAVNPPWLEQGKDLAPAMLAGGWDATISPDVNTIVSLADAPYSNVEAALAPLLKAAYPFIEREKSIWQVRAPVDAFVTLGHLVTTAQLKRFKEVVTAVFSQKRDEPKADQLFSIKAPDALSHSAWLRDGLATTLLLIAVFSDEAELNIPGGDPQAFVNEIVSNLPGLKSDARVLKSLKDELPFLAEAAPVPFMEALERVLEGDEDGIKSLFEETDGIFAPASELPHLLWALEVLAWDPRHLLRASTILAALSCRDPGGRLSNRPINSLREIFVVWSPNTNASLIQRVKALDAVINKFDAVGWSLLEKLLPQTHDSSGVTAKPRYRESGSSNREALTYGLVWEGQRAVVERAIEKAGENPTRWVSIIRSLPNMQEDLKHSVFGAVSSLISTTADLDLTPLWAELREEVARNESHPDAPWALSEPQLAPYRELLDRLTPSDSVKRSAWLFNEWHPSLGTKDDFDEENLRRVRTEALAGIVRDSGISGVIRLAESVQFPRFVADAAIAAASEPDFFAQILRAIVQVEGKVWDDFAVMLSSRAQEKFGARAAEEIGLMYRDGIANAKRISQLFFAWPDSPETWNIVASIGGEVDDQYWQLKPAWKICGSESDSEIAAVRYLHIKRPTAAIFAIDDYAKTIDVNLVLAILQEALDELAGQTGINGLLVHSIEKIFKSLRGRQDFPKDELIRLEFAYFPLLGSGEIAIFDELADQPKFFVELLTYVYKPKSGKDSSASEAERNRASAAFRILMKFRKMPGQKGEQVDSKVLDAWVNDTRALAKVADREDIADQHIGWLLAHAPVDQDGAWPHTAVRDLLEKLRAPQIERGIEVERHNMRGVFSKGLFEGGAQERSLADQNREWANATVAWPRTSEMLNRIAESWDWMAREEDSRARQDEMRRP